MLLYETYSLSYISEQKFGLSPKIIMISFSPSKYPIGDLFWFKQLNVSSLSKGRTSWNQMLYEDKEKVNVVLDTSLFFFFFPSGKIDFFQDTGARLSKGLSSDLFVTLSFKWKHLEDIRKKAFCSIASSPISCSFP